VVLKKECIVVLDIGLKRIGNLHGGGSAVCSGGNLTDGKNCLGKNVLIKVYACNGEGGSDRRVSVNNGVNVGTLLVNSHVHLDLGGGVKLTLELVTVLVYLDDHIGSENSLGYAGRSAVVLVVTNLDGDVTVVCCYEAKLIKNVTDFAYFFFDFVR
jgi:hypothetical protein